MYAGPGENPALHLSSITSSGLVGYTVTVIGRLPVWQNDFMSGPRSKAFNP